jgi:hypothetical protein
MLLVTCSSLIPDESTRLRTHRQRENPDLQAYRKDTLIREDGLSQAEVAELLGHHKSWVCRRLALLERLCPTSRMDFAEN